MLLPHPYCAISHPKPLENGQKIKLNATQLEGITLRGIKTKEAFTIVDKDGGYFRASVKQINAQSGQAIIYEKMFDAPESPIHITLFCAVLGRQRMLTVIQKATELGAIRVVPVITEHSVPFEGLAHQKSHAWPKQAIRAARQCRRASLPEVQKAISLSEALQHHCFTKADM